MANSKRIENEELAEDRGPVKGEAYGVAAVTSALQGIRFPVQREQILEDIEADTRIPWTQNTVIDLREIIENLPEKEFTSITELTQSISQAASVSA